MHTWHGRLAHARRVALLGIPSKTLRRSDNDCLNNNAPISLRSSCFDRDTDRLAEYSENHGRDARATQRDEIASPAQVENPCYAKLAPVSRTIALA